MSGWRPLVAGGAFLLALVLGGCGPGTDEEPVPVPKEWDSRPSPTGSGAPAG
jgi:hypothetical protein